MAHKCPNRCHKCPSLNGDVMPGCMGTAAFGRNDFARCTCRSEAEPSKQYERLSNKVAKLQEQIDALEERMAGLTEVIS